MMKGDRVRHTRTGECGILIDKYETQSPITRKVRILATVRLDDGRIISASGSDLEVEQKAVNR